MARPRLGRRRRRRDNAVARRRRCSRLAFGTVSVPGAGAGCAGPVDTDSSRAHLCPEHSDSRCGSSRGSSDRHGGGPRRGLAEVPTPTVVATPEPPAVSTESATTPASDGGDGIVFEAPGRNGLETLASGSWSASADALVNPGSSAVAEPWLVLSAVPSATFAVEAEIRVDGLLESVCDQSFGLTAGVPDADQMFGGGLIFPCAAEAARARLTDVSVWEDGYNADPVIAEEAFDPSDDWHTYRFELRGEELRLLVDGADVVSGTLDAPIDTSSGDAQAGLWAQGVGLEVRKVSVHVASPRLSPHPPTPRANPEESPHPHRHHATPRGHRGTWPRYPAPVRGTRSVATISEPTWYFGGCRKRRRAARVCTCLRVLHVHDRQPVLHRPIVTSLPTRAQESARAFRTVRQAWGCRRAPGTGIAVAISAKTGSVN